MYVSLGVRTGSPLRRKWARSGEEKGGSSGEKASDTYITPPGPPTIASGDLSSLMCHLYPEVT